MLGLEATLQDPNVYVIVVATKLPGSQSFHMSFHECHGSLGLQIAESRPCLCILSLMYIGNIYILGSVRATWS